MRHVLSSMAQRWLALHEEAKAHAASLKVLTAAAAPRLVEAVGVGYDTAAQMLITAGDNGNRVKSEAAFAKLCGACPIPAGSGKTNSRHRLYRGGNCRRSRDQLVQRERSHAAQLTRTFNGVTLIQEVRDEHADRAGR